MQKKSCIWNIHTVQLNRNKANVYYLGDFHLGQKSCDVKAIKDVVKRIAKDRYAVVIIMGDMIEMATKKAYQTGEVMPRKIQLRTLKVLLGPIRHKIVAVLTGNHERRIDKAVGVDYMEDAFMPFVPDAVYLGYEGWLNVELKGSSTLMYLHHGAGGSQNPEYWVKKLIFNNGIGVSAHVVASGHCHAQWHKLYTLPVKKRSKIVRKTVLGIRTGCYLGMADYAKISGFGVTELGGVMLKLEVADDYSVLRSVVYL